jgi:cell division protein ZapA (FtsZ GTPase activity inhibitor)
MPMHDELSNPPAFKTIPFKLMNRIFKIKCPSHEVVGFNLALNLLQTELDKLDPKHRSTDREKLLVTAALNLSQQVLLHQEHTEENSEAFQETLQNLKEKTQAAKDLWRIESA